MQAQIIYARLVHRGWLRRTIQLSGDSESLIEYDARPAGTWGRPQATVSVDRVVAATLVKRFPSTDPETEWAYGELGRHHLEFAIPTRLGAMPAHLHAEVDRSGVLVHLVSLRLVIGDSTLYDEGPDRLVITSPPSLPLAATGTSTGDRPLPASSPPESATRNPDDLPLPATEFEGARPDR